MEHTLGLFDAYGVEMEYMIVSSETLDVLPISDKVLTQAAGELTGEVELGEISWSNELALHVLELKVSEPVRRLDNLASLFQNSVQAANAILEPMGARLMPTAMHPWMNPDRDMKLWPHDYNPVYEAFHRIFNCRGHGWANLQSTHWNLPFKNDQEFARLHAAIRLVLPMLPALAASSPIYNGKTHGILDCRLDVYRRNSAKVPSITGSVVPEPVYSEADYDRLIYQPMFRDIAPWDPEGILQHIWLNARGAIARFDRGAIEIRVLDIQECPQADIAIGCLMCATLASLCDQTWTTFEQQFKVPTAQLAAVFLDAMRNGPMAEIPADIARHFGIDQAISASELWQQMFNAHVHAERLQTAEIETLDVLLRQGTLSQRILKRLEVDGEQSVSPISLKSIYADLSDCLAKGRPFTQSSGHENMQANGCQEAFVASSCAGAASQ